MLRLLPLFASLLFVGCAPQGSSLLDTAPKTKEDAPFPDFENPETAPVEEMETSEMTRALTGPNGELKDDDMRQVAQQLTNMGIQYHKVGNDQLVISIQEKVHFSSAKAELTPLARSLLNKLIVVMASKPELALVLDGHTDVTGDPIKNQNLSEQRSNEVRRYLLANKLNASQLYSRGFGEYLPLCDNDTILGRKCNRRVEITILKIHW
ncbi:OmpA family protein [Aliivibrio fischeri]|uniref:Membrane protein n=1 Tax=Aliivibrio fischeri TaxID=668 RepID=A0A510UJJ5_ALIFS|nr:OmpA family protein [Aliivibrio fischeri]MBP3139136.1 OmpA family protein [Aliivibrio fischeri]MBP3154726.1 OmpA family protein [Aliivibrio fischeri]MCE7574618.1 OmpA family protein [Aliivibrio fischeri]MUJ29656.1 OmpA family protein [Aliivibrio fischeri]MUJ39507.1 OmpA family protein [Aliivibrio fischeri]